MHGEQEKRIHYLCEDGIEKSVPHVTVCHHSASLVMPISDPRDRFFYPTLTLLIDSYSVIEGQHCTICDAKHKINFA